jgi:hypothetical protein
MFKFTKTLGMDKNDRKTYELIKELHKEKEIIQYNMSSYIDNNNHPQEIKNIMVEDYVRQLNSITVTCNELRKSYSPVYHKLKSEEKYACEIGIMYKYNTIKCKDDIVRAKSLGFYDSTIYRTVVEQYAEIEKIKLPVYFKRALIEQYAEIEKIKLPVYFKRALIYKILNDLKDDIISTIKRGTNKEDVEYLEKQLEEICKRYKEDDIFTYMVMVGNTILSFYKNPSSNIGVLYDGDFYKDEDIRGLLKKLGEIYKKDYIIE